MRKLCFGIVKCIEIIHIHKTVDTWIERFEDWLRMQGYLVSWRLKFSSMQTNILWTGREYYSLENCLINITDFGKEITSTIIGQYGEKLYLVKYIIRTNHNWETLFFEISNRHSNGTQNICFESDGKGNWTNDRVPLTQFNGCLDIDISLTPFTNSLPINRLRLSHNQEEEIRVIYIDLLEHQIVPARQRYRRLSETEYHYENIPNAFEAKIQVDEHGFVVDYPSLFVRKAVIESNFT